MWILIIIAIAVIIWIYKYWVESAFEQPDRTQRKDPLGIRSPKASFSFNFTFTWNGVDTADHVVYNPYGQGFRDECVSALRPFEREIAEAKGEVKIEVESETISDIRMRVTLSDMEQDLQGKIMAALPRKLGERAAHTGYGMGPRGGIYHIGPSGKKTYRGR
jgi:hypothetical protein